MSYLLPHLHSGWAVDQAILAEEERLVVIRFGHDWDETCMQMDEVLSSVAETIKNFAVIYLVDITEVPDFNTMEVHKRKVSFNDLMPSTCTSWVVPVIIDSGIWLFHLCTTNEQHNYYNVSRNSYNTTLQKTERLHSSYMALSCQ
ncbi:Thioredoxin-like protein 4a [Thalictrum thalictroides]|uniref:Thioredoxin-like protein 4a n=1 Tax=Thalictrum thalictroides TaxID=46969 RepID=A0A7J6VZ45_THATH|nr:Thioredoxin-like protein 4a [Thalictrum thalictroides]